MLRFWISLLLVLFAAPALAADWSHNNRIKPGENRSYEFTTLEDSSMLDARACATTVFSWDQDITGTQATGEAILYSCPKADSTSASCLVVNQMLDDQRSMAVGEKPGFFFVEPLAAPTGTAVSRVTAFCAKQYVGMPNYIRKVELFNDNIAQGGSVALAFSQPGFTRGYFVIVTANPDTGPSLQVSIRNGGVGNNWNICAASAMVSATDQILLMGGEGYESLGAVDIDCNRALSGDVEISMVVSGAGASMDVQLWFYGIPQ